MWFLIKSTVFLCLTLVVLSFFSTDDQNKAGLSATGVTNAVLSAGEIVHYMSGICMEKPDVCVKGAETLSVLGERTREGAKVAYQLLEGQLGDSSKTVAAPAPVPAEPATVVSEADFNAPDAALSTGTIAKSDALPQLAKIPVPLKRPANL